jgi:PAS domain S-box-containing protein
LPCPLSRKPVSAAALLALGAGLALTGILFVWLANREADESMKALEHAANVRQTAFQEEFQGALKGLTVVNSLFSGNESLSRHQFNAIATHLVEQYPFIQAFTFIRVIPAEKRAAFEGQMQQVQPGFSIVEIRDGKPAAAGDRPHYNVIEHVAPASSSQAALGLDITLLADKAPALERARSSGLPSATRLFNLLPEAGGHRAFAVLMPVYRQGTAARNAGSRDDAVVGYNAVVLRTAPLVESMLQRASMLHRPEVDISIYADSGGQQELVFRSDGLIGGATDTFTLPWTSPSWIATRRPAAAVRSFDAAGTRWNIVVSNPSVPAGHAPSSAWMALLAGSLVTVLLALYLQSLAVRAADLGRANARLKEDIAARKRIESALRESEARFHRLADMSSDWYWEQDAELRFTLVSGDTIFGSTPTRELIGKARWELPLEVDELDFEAHMTLLAEHKPFSDLEYRLRDANGRVYWMSVSGEPLFGTDGTFLGYRGTGKDITERKEAEQALRQSQTELRELAAHQARVKEDERKRIAREIHDDLGQNLLALRIDVSLLDSATRLNHPELNTSIRALLEQVDNVMRSVRAIINDLRPAVLDLGLQAAIEWQVQQFRQRTGITCVVEIDGSDIDRVLDEEAATSVFRILQESLTNVSRHAYASRVTIRLQSRYGRLALEIEDNGVGGFPGNARKPRSFGLIGIRERVYTLGGELRVTSIPGAGTTLTITIPASITSAAAA